MNDYIKPHNIISFVICAIFLLFSTNVKANSVPEYKFRHISVENGLPSNNIRALLQDKYGYIWIGTSLGLNRYDGNHIYNTKGDNADAGVMSLCEMGDTIWIGSTSGLSCYSQRSDTISAFRNKTANGTEITSTVTDVKTGKNGDVWISTLKQGIFRLTKEGKLEQYSMPEGGNSIGKMLVTINGEVWALSNWCSCNLARFNSKNNRFERIEPILNSPLQGSLRGIAITQDSNGYIWIGTWDSGVIRLNQVSLQATVVKNNSDRSLIHIHDIYDIGDDIVGISSDNGLSFLDTKTDNLTNYKEEELNPYSLRDRFVYPILKDREGGIWIGTYYEGVEYTHPTIANFTHYSHSRYKNSVNGNVINNFREDPDGNIWIASDDGGLTVFNRKEGTFASMESDRDKTRNVHGLCISGNTVYVGTYAGGIDIIDRKSGHISHYPVLRDAQGKIYDTSCYSILRSKEGRIWVGTFGSILEFDEKTGVFKEIKESKATVINIVEENNGNIWFVTDGEGLFKYNATKNRWTAYNNFNNGKSRTKIITNSVCFDSKGILWVATSGGLFRYDRNHDLFTSVAITGRYPSIDAITADNGKLWIASSMGLVSYDTEKEKCEHIYTSSDGLDNVNFISNSLFRASDGTIYIGTSHGFTAFRPQSIRNNVIEPVVSFTSFEIFNVKMESTESNLNEVEFIGLNHKENSIRVSFSAMSYIAPGKNKYQYYLEGYEENWNAPTKENYAAYTNLAPGEYVLHVRACNNDGIWSEKEKTLKLVITPPFYWNTWSQIFYVLLVLCGIYIIIRFNIKKKEKQYVAKVEEITEQKEHEVHEARIKFMTISDSDNEFLKALENVIEQNFSNPDISVDFLANEMNVSRSGLFAKVKGLADVTPNEMIQIIRLKHAARLLESKQYRINEICYMVGFNSPSYFTKCFTKHFGVKPAEYNSSATQEKPQ